MRYSRAHIANTLFDEQLRGGRVGPPFEAGPPVALQLQFLPLLYAAEEEAVVVYGRPNREYLERLGEHATLVGVNVQAEEFCFWGEISPGEVTRKVNSRKFLGGVWCQELPLPKMSFPFVIKEEFSYSGRGMLIVKSEAELANAEKFCARVFQKGEAVVLEPWLQRVRDFSSQWEIDETGPRLVGWTELFNTAHGSYLGTRIDPSFEEDPTEAEAVAQAAYREGYRGPAGVDAFVYLEKGVEKVRHVVELNARRTLGRVLLDFQRKRFPDRKIEARFVEAAKARHGLLPDSLTLPDNSVVKFTKQLDLML